ncbi:type 1 fimbrial protein [Klebsiella huaxiensis]|uniref:Type 1 fimbrial protein n=1 Tax=Klebsiella huaxiensis TaxID=2153354 RepID=A0ABT6EDY7_9ENTR|nr:type 1 fimbrial protein [Klebsiella huaxiensis]MDG1643630.1 type 1 fimbrial protein [Klebsiella huaxiensis]QBG08065.1 type 1 fimbrial protein [Klebsiella huaxiensis]VUT05610.1 hypothetical protein SB6421_04745 [Klebsiella huaxiensis]
MKIKLLALTLILSSPLLQASEGSLTLSGAITDSTCNILGVISDSKIGTAQPVLNPVITLTNLSEDSNSATSFRWFQIHIKNCYAAAQRQNIRIRLASPYADSSGYLRNAIRGGAQGKVIMLYERSVTNNSNQSLAVGQGRSATAWFNLPAQSGGEDGIIRLGFIASAHTAYGETATPGAFSTSVDYEMEYQ